MLASPQPPAKNGPPPRSSRLKFSKPFLQWLIVGGLLVSASARLPASSVARQWNELNLNAIRLDFPDPTQHARNLFHLSVAMWDAWVAYDRGAAVGCVHREEADAPDLQAAREEAISYAAYRILLHRYFNSEGRALILPALSGLMSNLGYPTSVTTTEGTTPAAVGNRIAAAVIAFAYSDDSREAFNYVDNSYLPKNNPLILSNPGTVMFEPNRWQPLAFETRVTQNGLAADKVQTFLGSHWGRVRPFAMRLLPGEVLYHDPGQPPQIGGVGDAEFKAGNLEVVRYSNRLDPSNGIMIDISPGAIGNNPLGENSGTGHPSNPATGLPYPPNLVKHGDFGRVLAEFWADGPDSETPPGHWNVLANEVMEHPDFERRWQGSGPEIDPLEWDVKMYLALNGALHDAAVTAWGCKRAYDYVRPISSIRYMAERGQSSDPNQPSYDTQGWPLEAGLVEVITAESSAPGQRHAHLASSIGEIALHCWVGEPDDAETQFSGTGWILARQWFPYQRATFVTPAFAGYVSGHSTFSRAAAEVLTHITGSPYFPGGLGSFTAVEDDYLEFEIGPSTNVILQWATYYDAADQAGISRLYGGIHVPVDDGPGRIMGSAIGTDAWERAASYFDGSVVEQTFNVEGGPVGDEVVLNAETIPGLYYQVQTSHDLIIYTNLGDPFMATDTHQEIVIPDLGSLPDQYFVRVIQSAAP